MIDEFKSNSGRFIKLNQHSYEIMNDICNDKQLARLIYYPNSDALDTEMHPDVINPTDMIGVNILPSNFVPDITTETQTFINVYFDNFSMDKKSMIFKNGQLKFTIWVHKDNINLDMGNRLYYIMSRIDDLFNYSRDLGVGFALFNGASAIAPNIYYCGYTMVYSIRQNN